MWTFRCYDDGTPENLWRRWYDHDADFIAKGSHDRIFDELEQLERWEESGHTRPFVGKTIEVKITIGIQWRVIGFYRSGRTFVVLGICYHKQRVYTPHGIQKTVVKRKKEVIKDIERAPICERPR
jgi:hypothetical protein